MSCGCGHFAEPVWLSAQQSGDEQSRNQDGSAFRILPCLSAFAMDECETQLPKTQNYKESKWGKDAELRQACSGTERGNQGLPQPPCPNTASF